MKKFENKSKNKKGKSHRFFGVSPKIQRSSNLLFPLQARGLEGIKCILNICACFWRLPRLRFAMTFPILTFAFILCLCLTGESWAACVGATATTAGTDEETHKPCGICNESGTCKWNYDTTTKELIFSGSGVMDNYDNESVKGIGWIALTPWKDYIKDVKTVKFAEGHEITKVGDRAFYSMSNLTSASLAGVKEIGNWAFWHASSLTDLNILDATSIGSYLFQGSGLTELIIPDSWADKTMHIANNSIFYGSGFTKFICQGDINKCKKALGSHSDMVVAAEKSQCYGNYGWDGKNCIRKNADGSITCAYDYVNYKGQCLDEYPFAKKHYTPAEAAQWLNEDNNTVTLTFKK